MGSYIKDIQRHIRGFKKEVGKRKYTPKEIARWMIENGHYETPMDVAIKKCAEDVSRALHEMQTVDPQGRKVRTEHVLYSDEGKQLPLWANWEDMTREEMELSFKGRRRGILVDCKRLKSEVDSYNENVNPEKQKPIQLGFNFEFELRLLELGEEELDTVSAIEQEQPPEPFRIAARGSASERALSRP